MDIQLRDYQKRDVTFMAEHKRVLNANEPGLGKTLEALTVLSELGSTKTLVICPKIATGVWQSEAKRWYGWDSIIMTGTPKKRKEQRREFYDENLPILITNFALLNEIQAMNQEWNTIIVDEAHLGGLLNRKSQKFKLMKKLESTNLFILTGTPVRKGPHDLWSLLHLLYPKTFRSYWRYIDTYCVAIDTPFGKEIAGRPKNAAAFKEMLSNYMVRNTKTEVLKDLPVKQRQAFPLELEGRQKQLYDELLAEMLLNLDSGEILLTPNRMTQDLRLRQLLVCPRLLGIDEDGIALTTLVEYLIPREFDAKRAVVIGTPFRQAIPYIVERLEKAFPDSTIEQIHGGIKENANDVAKRFQAIPGYKKILIYTIKAGASWTAHTASTGFMLGYEWDANDNTQAEDRIHRIGQENKVFWYYLLHKDTVDEAVISKLNEKVDAINWCLRAQDMLDKLQELRAKQIKKNSK